MRREEFEQHFFNYRKYLRDEIHRFRDSVAVYRQIQECKSDRMEVINQAPAFFGVVEGALFTSIVLWGDKLFDEKGERGLFNFLIFVENNRKWLTTDELQRRKGYPDGHWMLDSRVPITTESIEQDRQEIRSWKHSKAFEFAGQVSRPLRQGDFFDRQRLQLELRSDEATLKKQEMSWELCSTTILWISTGHFLLGIH